MWQDPRSNMAENMAVYNIIIYHHISAGNAARFMRRKNDAQIHKI